MNKNKRCFVSWSGGKDSCLALYKAIQQGFEPLLLFTMFSLEYRESSSHRVGEDVLKAQADALGIKHLLGRASFHEYEKVFVSNLIDFKKQGIEIGIFGDIDIDEHKEWEDMVCAKASMVSFLPLWNMKRRDVLIEFLETGFKAKIVVVDTTMLNPDFLGRDLNREIMEEIKAAGADVCGETGEYHTIVYDGPIFKKPLDLKLDNEIKIIEDRWAKIKTSIQ